MFEAVEILKPVSGRQNRDCGGPCKPPIALQVIVEKGGFEPLKSQVDQFSGDPQCPVVGVVVPCVQH